jgi:tetratricopeptide (TPR) repeat protein
MYYISRIAGAFALAALGIAVWYSIVLARADSYFRAATPETVERAVEIAPRNTDYLALRALQLDYDGADSTELREKIAALNPYSSAPRIRLGLAAEIQGDSAKAERWLLEAARVDHQFEPGWTLANFYFRAERREEFWTWMRFALEVSYGDRTPAFDLCWRASSDAGKILQRGIPDRHEVVAAYLVYLLRTEPPQRRLPPRMATPQDVGTQGVVDVARRLAAYHDGSDLPMLFGACDRLLAARDSAAVEVWQMMGQAAPAGIFNGDFSTVPLNHGFDWRLIESPGVTHVSLSAPSGHRIAFSGQQAESCSLLAQALDLKAGKHYRLHWEARTADMKSPSGLQWRVGGQHAALFPSEDWTPGELTMAATEVFQVLELAYQRPIGESRTEGNVELRQIRLVEVAP